MERITEPLSYTYAAYLLDRYQRSDWWMVIDRGNLPVLQYRWWWWWLEGGGGGIGSKLDTIKIENECIDKTIAHHAHVFVHQVLYSASQ